MLLLGASADVLVPTDWRGDRLYFEFEHLGAKSDLLIIGGSYGDTMADEWVLEELTDGIRGANWPRLSGFG